MTKKENKEGSGVSSDLTIEEVSKNSNGSFDLKVAGTVTVFPTKEKKGHYLNVTKGSKLDLNDL